MKNLRFLLSLAVLVLLTVGYGVSQYAALTGWAADYATKVDCPTVAWLALFFLLISIVLSLVRDPEANEK